jgi:hypothetical protein
MHFYLKKKQRKSYFRKVLENSRVDFFFEIYNKFVKISYGFGQYFNNPKNFNS